MKAIKKELDLTKVSRSTQTEILRVLFEAAEITSTMVTKEYRYNSFLFKKHSENKNIEITTITTNE